MGTAQPDPTVDPDPVRLLFDAEFYQGAYGHLLGEESPFDHYMRLGWRTGLNPNAWFDSARYLAANPDVAARDVNPLWHFAWAGAAERRSSVRRDVPKLQRHVLQLEPPSARARHYGGAADRRPRLEEAALVALLRESRSGAPAGLVVSASHDRYRLVTGGVQSLVAAEEGAFRDRGVCYLHLAPAAPVPMLAVPPTPGEPAAFTLTLDGEDVGVVELRVLRAALRQVAGLWPWRRCIVHHLMGHAPEAVAAVAAEMGPERPIVWTHDFFTICPSYALLRNDVAFCGGPPPDSGACTICVYGGDRRSHVGRMQEFFRALEPDIMAPSASALGVWRERGRYAHASARVVPLARFEPGPMRRPPLARRGGGPLRVAFIGAPALHKGWHAYEALAHRHFDDPRYAFHAFGAWSEGGRGIRHVPVTVLPGARNAMIEALEAHGIDVVVNWTLCQETFSFTTTEALAAGCYVLVRRESGNAWPQVRALGPRHGAALDSEIELQALFASGAVIEAARHDRPGGRIRRGAGSADIVGPEGAA